MSLNPMLKILEETLLDTCEQTLHPEPLPLRNDVEIKEVIAQNGNEGIKQEKGHSYALPW